MAAFIERFIPDIVVKLLIGVDPVGMSGQKRQNIEFNAGKFAVSAIEGNGAVPGVDDQAVELKDFRRAVAVALVDSGPDPKLPAPAGKRVCTHSRLRRSQARGYGSPPPYSWRGKLWEER